MKLLGPIRTKEIMQAQLSARGMQERCSKEDLRKRRFTPWIPAELRKEDLVSGAWASLVVAEVNAANLACGNHVCKPEVCHKTRRGQDGTCRLGYWEYAKSTYLVSFVCCVSQNNFSLTYSLLDRFGVRCICLYYRVTNTCCQDPCCTGGRPALSASPPCTSISPMQMRSAF